MRYGSVCSGIEAATVAWHSLGWEAKFLSEIEAYPRSLLQHHYPKIPLHGDFTTIGEKDYGSIDLLVGGTPCQSFSIAGLREGINDDRGNLALEFLRLAKRKEPKWILWENVPRVLSSTSHESPDIVPPPAPLDMEREGQEMVTEDEYNAEEIHAFNCFLAGLQELGYGYSSRVLDAQYFGVPQRRRRVFVVGCLGDWRRPAAVLFESESLQGDITPSKEAWEDNTRDVAKCLTRRGAGGLNHDPETANFVCTLGHTTSNGLGISKTHLANTLEATGSANQAVVLSPPLTASQGTSGYRVDGFNSNTASYIPTTHRPRRFTPKECERLQGFPDDYTLVPYLGKPASDSVRYKALGNSMAIPVMKWLGERIEKIEGLL